MSFFVNGIEEIILPGIGRTERLVALAHQYETSPDGSADRDLTARFWYQLAPGQYEVAYGPNDGTDHIQTDVYTGTFQIDRPGSTVTFPIPYTTNPNGEEWVLEFTRLATQAPNKDVSDLGVAERDISLVATPFTTEVNVTVHNVGNQTVTDAAYQVWAVIAGGAPFQLPNVVPDIDLEAPNDLNPRRLTLSWQGAGGLASGTEVTIAVFLNFPVGGDDNPNNDAVIATFVVD